MESFYQFNTDKEWTNLNMWGSSMIPLDVGASNFLTTKQVLEMN